MRQSINVPAELRDVVSVSDNKENSTPITIIASLPLQTCGCRGSRLAQIGINLREACFWAVCHVAGVHSHT